MVKDLGIPVFGLNGLQFNDFFEFSKIKSTRANHNYKLYVKAARVNCYKHSFFIRIVKEIGMIYPSTLLRPKLSTFLNQDLHMNI